MSGNQIDVEAADATFTAARTAFHATAPAVEEAAELAAVRLLAAHARSVAPAATHMLMETSDQGRHMCPPHWLTDDTGQHVAEAEWDAHYEDTYDDLSDAAAWLTWGHESWQQYADLDHPYTNDHGGYYALDLRRIVAGAAGPGEEDDDEDGHEYEVTIKLVLNMHAGEDVRDVLADYLAENGAPGIPEPVSVIRV